MNTRKSSGATALAAQPRSRKKRVRSTAAAPLYAVHPSIDQVQRWIADLRTTSGRSLDEWLAHIRSAGPKDERGSREWLAQKYGLRTNHAWWLAEKAFGDVADLAEDTPAGYLKLAPQYVERMYAGPKSHLRPLHDLLIELARGLADVRICPCQSMVPLFRKHVFAQIRPATTKRIDLGLALGEEPFTSRLLDTGGRAKKDRITHRVALHTPEDVDLQVRRWLKQAYERDG